MISVFCDWLNSFITVSSGLIHPAGFPSFKHWLRFYRMYVQHSVCPFIRQWTPGLLLSSVNHDAVNRGVQLPLQDRAFRLFGFTLRSGCWPCGISDFSFWGTAIFLQQVYTLRPHQRCTGASASPRPGLVAFCFPERKHPNGYEVESHTCYLHFPCSWVGKIPWRRKRQTTPVFLSWRIPWTGEPRGHGVARVGHDWATKPNLT